MTNLFLEQRFFFWLLEVKNLSNMWGDENKMKIIIELIYVCSFLCLVQSRQNILQMLSIPLFDAPRSS
jgi:hypothetical protein